MPLDCTPKPSASKASPHAVHELESKLKANIYRKAPNGGSEEKTLRAAFKVFDLDGSGEISFDEFERALERFGAAGVATDVLQALFNKYNTDGSDAISYEEFSAGLFHSSDAAAGMASQSAVGADIQPIETTANPWLPSLQGCASMDPGYTRPHPERPAVRNRSIAWSRGTPAT